MVTTVLGSVGVVVVRRDAEAAQCRDDGGTLS
jgi:hypothetical protein